MGKWAHHLQHLFRRFREDALQVLVNGVGCALIPLVADTLHGGQDLDELPGLRREDVPAVADMSV